MRLDSRKLSGLALVLGVSVGACAAPAAGSAPAQAGSSSPAGEAAAGGLASAPVAATGPNPQDHEHDADGEPHDDGFDEEVAADPVSGSAETAASGASAAPLGPQPPARHPYEGKSAAELAQMLELSPADLGSLSLGRPSGGRLINGVQLPESPKLYKRVDPAHEWATQETIDYLTHSIERVHEQFPNTPPLHVGHISGKKGGHLKPHLSHQLGRDIDISYFYSKGARWYARGTKDNLDLPRTWAFVRALICETDVDILLIDHSIQRLLRAYAESIGEDKAWLDDIFKGRRGKYARGLIHHARGHATHIHIRFFNPVAQESARRLYPALIARKIVKPPEYFLHHRVRRGETLGKLARRYKTTIKAIKRANGLRSSLIREKHTYKIPKESGVKPHLAPVRIPARRVAPSNPSAKKAPSAAPPSAEPTAEPKK